MSGSLAEVLLRIAAAVAADRGGGVRSALESALAEAAPFDMGEVVFVGGRAEPRSFPLQGAEEALVGRDLLDHVLAHGDPYRIDDWRDAEPFAETLGRLRRSGLRSVLALPFRFEESGQFPVTGALVLARSHGWAFVGASLPRLVPLAGMAGLALDRALRLSALAERAQALEVFFPRDKAERFEPGETRAARDEPGRDLGALVVEAETRLRDTERVRDDWARQAVALRQRVEEQEAEIRSLKEAREQGATPGSDAVAPGPEIPQGLRAGVDEPAGTPAAVTRGRGRRPPARAAGSQPPAPEDPGGPAPRASRGGRSR
jgi:hypothetical protein